jgi:hypothetical protein
MAWGKVSYYLVRQGDDPTLLLSGNPKRQYDTAYRTLSVPYVRSEISEVSGRVTYKASTEDQSAS